jgi:hypothetical protein
MNGYDERSTLGKASEERFRRDMKLRSGGRWQVDNFGRGNVSQQFHEVLNTWHDPYGNQCRLKNFPDFLVWMPGLHQPSSLYGVAVPDIFGVDVKTSVSGCHIARIALDTYVAIEQIFHLPVAVVFHDVMECTMEERMAFFAGKQSDVGQLKAIMASDALLNSTPHHGKSDFGSGQPYYVVDLEAVTAEKMDKFFGVPKIAKAYRQRARSKKKKTESAK